MKSLELKKDNGLTTPVRRSSRLNALYSRKSETQLSPDTDDLEEKDDDSEKSVEISGGKCDYEGIRNARISENMVRKMDSVSLLRINVLSILKI